MQLITDMELRAHWYKTREKTLTIEKGAFLTPAARDFIREHGIQLTEDVEEGRKEPLKAAKMPQTNIPVDEKQLPIYIKEETGEQLSVKPENMTHLYGNVLVSKADERIGFRGQLDSLEARMLELEQFALRAEREDLRAELEELLLFVRGILGAEVRLRPLENISILGMDSEMLRQKSHNIQKYFGIPHPVPSGDMGEIPLKLNALRTKVREAELAAVRAYGNDARVQRDDIIEAMNRLSSCVYLLFCREVAKSRGRKAGQNRLSKTRQCKKLMPEDIPVEASGRHVHLTPEAAEILFGKKELTPKNPLSQPGQYAAKERVTIMTSKGEFENVAVLGPARKEVQVELSMTDARVLGIQPPVNLSGNLNKAASVILKGPCGIFNAVQSAIVSRAHIHMTSEDAGRFQVEDGESVSLRIDTDRPVTIDDVIIRVSDKYSLAAHLDYDEANACGYQKGNIGHIVK